MSSFQAINTQQLTTELSTTNKKCTVNSGGGSAAASTNSSMYSACYQLVVLCVLSPMWSLYPGVTSARSAFSIRCSRSPRVMCANGSAVYHTPASTTIIINIIIIIIIIIIISRMPVVITGYMSRSKCCDGVT